jgi:hypothetical protein
MFHDPLTSDKPQGVTLWVFRFHLQRPKLLFYVRKFHCTSHQLISAANHIKRVILSLWVRACTVVTFWSSWSIILPDIEPHIYHRPARYCSNKRPPQFASANEQRSVCSAALHATYECCFVYNTDIFYENTNCIHGPLAQSRRQKKTARFTVSCPAKCQCRIERKTFKKCQMEMAVARSKANA